jgi:hypothetical protein
VRRSLVLFLEGMLLLGSAVVASGQSVSLNESITYAQNRIGLNQGIQNVYDSLLISNITGMNPGFQPIRAAFALSVRCGTCSTTQFEDRNSSNQVPTNYFARGTYYVAAGADKGQSGTISANSTCSGGPGACTGADGPVFTVSGVTHPFASNDVVDVYQTVNCVPFNYNCFWWDTANSGNGTVVIDSTPSDQPPDSTGVQDLEFAVTSPGDVASISTGYDTGKRALYIMSAANGPFIQSVYAKVKSGCSRGCTITLSGYRSDGIRWSGKVTPTAKWATLSYTFAGTEILPPANPIHPSITVTSASGPGSVLVAQSYVGSTLDLANHTIFRNQVLAIENPSHYYPGCSRFWAGTNAAESFANWTKNQYGRATMFFNSGANFAYNYGEDYGLYDWLQKNALTEVPCVWISVPIVSQASTEAALYSQFLGGSCGTTGGAVRCKQGQLKPWTSVFDHIVVEFGNEPWNAGTQGQYIPYNGANWPYLTMAVDWCTAMKADSSYQSNMECTAALQTGGNYWQRGLETLDTGHSVDQQSQNFYGQYAITNTSGDNIFTSALTEPYSAANDPTNGFYQGFAARPQASMYEGNNNTSSGLTQTQTNGYADGEGYGLVNILWPLINTEKWHIPDWNVFTMFQNTTRLGGNSAHLWGVYANPGGVHAYPRPTALAIGMVNQCIGTSGTAYAATGSSVPTYNFPGYNSVGAINQVPYLYWFAFKRGSTRCMVVVNTDLSNSHTFTVTGTNPPSAEVKQVLYSSANLTDTNESLMMVNLVASTLTNPTVFTIPAHSAETLTWEVHRSPAGQTPKETFK